MPKQLAGRRIGLFVGVSTSDYAQLLFETNLVGDALSSTVIAHSILANRVSYILDLCGPSESIDTACSSVVVAIHRALQSIYSGESEQVIAGGVNLLLSPQVFISLDQAGLLSRDGKVKSFGKGAHGYVRGEGVGAVLLKQLSKAIQDKDHIYAVIKGTSVNNGGRRQSLTTPSAEAQAQAIITAYHEADIAPSTVSYIEAHGTVTEPGDSIEIEAFKKAFKKLGVLENNYCGIGNLKPNIGYLETASGIAALIKLIFALKNKKLPGLPGFEEINPYINIEKSPFYIVKETQEWKCLKDEKGREIPRRASLNSFGYGGVNAHIVIEEYPQEVRPEKGEVEPELIILSAKDEKRLKAYAANLFKSQWVIFPAACGD